eukprot:GHUV01000924.1.p1 GENE.GHUV01000924.1~~GHUV01000924.1.p1  ORF type:complete len:786 (+),score=186.91 GHUV01000924.1:228-2585(+)
MLHCAAAFAVICLSLPLVAADTVQVTDGQALVDAIQTRTVTSIEVGEDVRFEPGQWPSAVYRLERNLTVLSHPVGSHKVIDFNARSVKSKLSIGAGYNLSFIHLTLKDTRYGAGADIDILAPSPDGILYLQDLAKLQYSCPPLVKSAILAYQRDPSVPGVNNITFPEHVSWDGKDYEGSIHYSDFSTRMAGGENLYESGYVVQKLDTYKLCERVVTPECIAAYDAATCVRQDMDADDYARYPPQPQPQQLSRAAKAGVAVAAAVAAAAILAAAVLLLLRHRHSQQQEELLPVKSDSKPSSESTPNGTALIPATEPKTYTPKGLGDAGQGDAGQGAEATVVVFDTASGSGSGSGSGLSTGSLGLTNLPPMRDSTDSVVTPDSSRCLLAGRGFGTSPTAAARGIMPTTPRVPDIIRGTMTQEQAASIQLGTMVGAGSFGRVYHGSLGEQEVAIKVINHSGQNAKQVANEVELMMKFDHRNLVKAHHYITWGSSGVSLSLSRPERMDRTVSSNLPVTTVSSSSFPDSNDSCGPMSARESTRMVETWVISEYCNAGNLQDAVMQQDGGLFFHNEVPQMGFMLRTLLGVSNAMEWLHSRNVLHGDLKSANVMLHIDSTDDAAEPLGDGSPAEASEELELVPKVVDFGLSRVIAQGVTHLSTHTFGTITHQPPELMRSGRLSKQADVYSFGVLMWEMVMASHPWHGKMMGEIMTAVMIEGKRLEFPPAVPQAYARVAKRCFEEDPLSRPTFSEISAQLEHLLNKESALQGQADAAYIAVSQQTVVVSMADG